MAMKSDAQLQQDVLAQIKQNPLLTAAAIGVAVNKGVVTLSGLVDNYLKKTEAEKEVQQVAGVMAIAEDIQVGPAPDTKKSDTELALAVVKVLQGYASLAEEEIKVKVEEGVVTLTGEVEWRYQREAAKDAVAPLAGIRFIVNGIQLKPKVTSQGLQEKIEAAFHRSATLDAHKIQVDIKGNKAVLKGQVRSFAEREDAEKVAWSAPGILYVDNQLELKLVDPEGELPADLALNKLKTG
jgi:osmotically-inducible protein OsmY